MDTKALKRVIRDLEIIQIIIMQQRRDHNGQVLEHNDVDVINQTIEILSNLVIEPKHIWRKRKTK